MYSMVCPYAGKLDTLLKLSPQKRFKQSLYLSRRPQTGTELGDWSGACSSMVAIWLVHTALELSGVRITVEKGLYVT
jgi:hypothetical protein